MLAEVQPQEEVSTCALAMALVGPLPLDIKVALHPQTNAKSQTRAQRACLCSTRAWIWDLANIAVNATPRRAGSCQAQAIDAFLRQAHAGNLARAQLALLTMFVSIFLVAIFAANADRVLR